MEIAFRKNSLLFIPLYRSPWERAQGKRGAGGLTFLKFWIKNVPPGGDSAPVKTLFFSWSLTEYVIGLRKFINQVNIAGQISVRPQSLNIVYLKYYRNRK